MFEFYVAEEQIIDASYLEYLTDKLVSESKENSSEAWKRAFKRLAMSETYSQPDIVSGECYDFAPGNVEDGRRTYSNAISATT